MVVWCCGFFPAWAVDGWSHRVHLALGWALLHPVCCGGGIALAGNIMVFLMLWFYGVVVLAWLWLGIRFFGISWLWLESV